MGREQGDDRITLGLLVEQPAEELRGEQRNVTVGHDHVAHIVRDARQPDSHGIGRAELRILADGRYPAFEHRLDLLARVADDHDPLLDAGARQGVEHVRQDWPAGQRMEDLGQPGTHPPALSGGQDDGRISCQSGERSIPREKWRRWYARR